MTAPNLTAVPGTIEPRPWCENCGNHRAEIKWVADGGALALVHGSFSWWCVGCALRAQIAHAEKEIERLPSHLVSLRGQLAEWEARA